jgi:hypothetical protein
MPEPDEDPTAETRPDPCRCRGPPPPAVERLREARRRKAAVEELAAAFEVTGILGAAAVAELARDPRIAGQPDPDHVAVTAVVRAGGGAGDLGVPGLADVADRLTFALPETLRRSDRPAGLTRPRAIAEAAAASLAADRPVERALRASGMRTEGPGTPRVWGFGDRQGIRTRSVLVALTICRAGVPGAFWLPAVSDWRVRVVRGPRLARPGWVP